MTDRRRNFLILTFVAALLAGSLYVIFTKPTKQGLDLKGGVSLIYEAKPTKDAAVDGDSIQRTIDIMTERVNQLGVSEAEIQRSGENQIDVSLPDVQDVEQAQAQVGTTAQLYFYNWEANVVGADGKPAPDDESVTGGQSAGQPGSPASLTYFAAVKRASGFDPLNLENATHNGLWYGVDTKTKKVLCGPQEDKADVAEICKSAGAKPNEFLEVPKGYIVVQAQFDSEDKAAAKAAADSWFILRDSPSLNGSKDVKDPKQDFDQTPGSSGGPIVTFNFSKDGRKKWEEVTKQIAQFGAGRLGLGGDSNAAAGHFAIVLDNRLITVPTIDPVDYPNGIDGVNGSQISGTFKLAEAQRLANLIKTGALPLRLELISNSQVSATLGQQALDQGIVAALVGFALVALFLIAFYRVLGVIAVGALIVYTLYLIALVKLIPVTLTLPGIAGLVLTLGVAADANIVIFERVKEEIRAGRSTASAISTGYRKGISTIIDANVVTVMVAFILFVLATAGVKGFALMLGLGTLTSLFTAVLATQAVLGTLQKTRLMQRPSALGAKAEEDKGRWRFDYTGASKWFFSGSGLILLVCALAIGANGLNFGIDFESGTRAKVAFVSAQQPSNDAISEALQKAGFENPKVQAVNGDKELGGSGLQISLSETGRGVANLEKILRDEFGNTKALSVSSIGPTFGETIAKGAIIAIIASLLVISIYIALRFEWKFAVPVLIALVHDLLITAGVYSLTGREVTTSTVAALLTILGYSLYDTIIVFDRVRENVPRMPRAAFSQIVNRSMSEVIVRSLVTSLSTGLPILALLIFGGDTLKDFAFALLIGVLSGAYSSIFIANPVLVHWKEREQVYRNRRKRISAENGGFVPAYATGGAAVIAPEKEKVRSTTRLTSPEDPERRVSKAEFDAMVADISDDVGTGARNQPEPEFDPTADASPEDLVMKDPKGPKPKRPKNKRHGRPR